MARQGTTTRSSVPAAFAQARRAGLRYVSDAEPGIARKRQGGRFRYVSSSGKPIRNRRTLDRIRGLVIPPAWSDVWICPFVNGHLQATGFDDRGRKQYLYHERWRETRDLNKYGRLIDFARALPKIRRRVGRDLARRGLPREKVLAAVVKLLETALVRVGNEEYAKSNGSFGLTTMRDRHAGVRGAKIIFDFHGKSGKRHEIEIEHPRLARVVRKCQDLPGQKLFQYVDEGGEVRSIDSRDVNDYLREIGGTDFTAKDFRTWAGTVLAAAALQESAEFDSKAGAKKYITAAIASVAKRLGNTKAVCRKCYIHPAVFDAYLDRTLVKSLKSRTGSGSAKLPAQEAAVFALLRQRLTK